MRSTAAPVAKTPYIGQCPGGRIGESDVLLNTGSSGRGGKRRSRLGTGLNDYRICFSTVVGSSYCKYNRVLTIGGIYMPGIFLS